MSVRFMPVHPAGVQIFSWITENVETVLEESEGERSQ